MRHRSRRDTRHTACLANGVGARFAQALNNFGGQAVDCRKIQIGRNHHIVLSALLVDGGFLAADVAGVFGLDFNLLGDCGVGDGFANARY